MCACSLGRLPPFWTSRRRRPVVCAVPSAIFLPFSSFSQTYARSAAILVKEPDAGHSKAFSPSGYHVGDDQLDFVELLADLALGNFHIVRFWRFIQSCAEPPVTTQRKRKAVIILRPQAKKRLSKPCRRFRYYLYFHLCRE